MVLPVLAALAWVTSIVPFVGSVPLSDATVAVQVRLTWITATPRVSPPALQYASAVYDSDTKAVVLFGGQRSDGTLSDDTWVWDGSNWTDYPGNQVQAPPARKLASMGFDPSRHELILFGGQGAAGQLLGDTWAWNGASWYQEPVSLATAEPGAREAASLAYDGAGHLLLYGGTGFAKAALSTGSGTSSLSGSGSSSSGGGTSTGTSGSSGNTSTDGGIVDATSGSTTTTSTTIASTSPAPTVLGDAWKWVGTGWTPAPTGPPARSGAALAADSTTKTLVLFGGESTPAGSSTPRLLSDTWTWNGSAWSAQSPASKPPARASAALSDNPVVGGAVLFAGTGAGGALGDTWMWNGTTWRSVVPAGQPLLRAGAAAAYDPAAREYVVFGGVGPNGAVLGDTLVMTAIVSTAGGSGSLTGQATSTTSGTRPVAPDPTRPAHTATKSPPKHKATATSGEALGPTGGAPLAVTARILRPGQAVTLSGSGFAPGAQVTITFHSAPQVVGVTDAGPDGQFSTTVTVPIEAPAGNHHFEATGPASAGRSEVLTAAVVVVALHTKGFPVQTVVMVTLAILLPLGAWASMSGAEWWRRRRSATAPPL